MQQEKDCQDEPFANAVIENLDVFGDLALRLLAGEEPPVMYQFSFQSAPETFHRRGIPTVLFATHRYLHAELTQLFLASMTTILANAINQPCCDK